MNRARVAAIAFKEIRAVTRSRAVWVPMVALPSLLFVIIPAAIALLPQLTTAEELTKEVGELFAKLPPELRARFPLDRPGLAMVELMLGQMLAPLFVLVPVMTASLIAADAFAGERERHTLEALLHTPVTERELFAGKVLGAFLPSLAVSTLGLLVVSVVADVAAWPLAHRLLLPDAMWLAMALVLAPAISGLAIIVMVIISARVRGFQEASQLGGLIVLPVIGLTLAQISGALALSPLAVVSLGLGVVVLDVATIAIAARAFNRESLFLRL